MRYIRLWIFAALLVIGGFFAWWDNVQEDKARERYRQQGYVETDWQGTAEDCEQQGGYVDTTANICVLP